MDPGTVDVVEFVVALGVKIPLGLAIVGWDERRLAVRHPDWFLRRWPPASRLSAIVVFQEIGIWIHFWRTRRWSAAGFSLGLAVAIAYVLATGLVLVAIDALLLDS